MTKLISTVMKWNPILVAVPHFSAKALTLSWPFLAVIFAHLIWGGNFIVAKLALQEIPPMSLAFIRFSLSLLLLIPFLLAEKKRVLVQKKDLTTILITGLLMVTFNISFFYLGLTKTTATSASILTLIIPMLSVLAGWWFLKEHIYTINLFGVFLGFLGAVFILGAPVVFSGDQLNPQNMIGNVLIILASITWVAGALLSKKLAKNYSTLTITAFIFFVGIITFFIPALAEYLENPDWPAHLTPLGVLGMIYITILSSVSAYFLFEWGLNKLGVFKADLFQYIEPLVAVSLAWLLLSETPAITFVFGGVLIGIGVFLSTLGKNEHKHHKAHRH